MTNKNIIFDWFTLFSFHENFKLGKPRKLVNFYIKKLVNNGWRVFIFRPNILYTDPFILRNKVKRAGIPVFEILYSVRSLKRVPFKRGVYIDMAYFYLIGALWILLWFNCLSKLRKIK